MAQVFLAILVSVLLAEWLEFWYRFGATTDPEAFFGALAPYTLIAFAFHLILRLVPRLPVPVWLVLGAVPGMALEWFIIGNSPWGNPAATQLGMLVFHGSWPIWGRVFDPDWFGPRQRRWAMIWMAGWSVALLPGFLFAELHLRYAFFVILPLIPYAGLALMALTGRPRERSSTPRTITPPAG